MKWKYSGLVPGISDKYWEFGKSTNYRGRMTFVNCPKKRLILKGVWSEYRAKSEFFQLAFNASLIFKTYCLET